MSSDKKSLFKTLLTVNAGSCVCGKPKFCDVYEPKPKSKTSSASATATATTQNLKLSSSSPYDKKNDVVISMSEIDNDDLTSTSFSFNIDTTASSTLNSESESDRPRPSRTMLSPCPKIVDSVVVVKDSNDPYQDFRHSMLQMILEKEIYSKSDLQGLLQCFLELNSPCHHDVIVKAFMEIWNQVSSKDIIAPVAAGEKHEPGYASGTCGIPTTLTTM